MEKRKKINIYIIARTYWLNIEFNTSLYNFTMF